MLYHKTQVHYDNTLYHQKQEDLKDKNSDSVAYTTMQKKYKREQIMIVTEGSVFLLILIFLVFKVKKSVENEIQFSRQQQNFILSITHELKSPLSSIKLMSQTLKKHNLNEEQKQKMLTNSLSEVNRLQNLVENVLLAAKLDNNAYGFSKKELDISNLSEELVERCKTASNKNIDATIEPNISMQADPSAFSSVLINLLENAIKYSPENAKILFELKNKNEHILLRVIDEGIGISDEEKLKVFNKFYRVGNEEVRATKGTGLGLYIVKEIVKFHNGNISIKNNSPRGSIFELIF